MSDKEPAVDEVAQVDEYSLEEQGERRAEFLAGIKEGSEQALRGEGISIEEARRRVKEWACR